VLVNNAGIQNWMTISDDDFYEKATAEITTNIVPIHLTSLFIKLKSLNTIINVTLTGLCAAFKGACLLCNKGVFHSFTISMRHLKRKKIEVIEMIPALNTDLAVKAYTTANQKSVIL
jgi:uncharacterized oxidoreductase